MNKSLLVRLFWPLVFVAVFLGVVLSWDRFFFPLIGEFFGSLTVVLGYVVRISFWLSLGWFTSAIFRHVFCDFFIERRLGWKMPQLIKDMISLLIYFTAVLAIIGIVFEESVTGLLTASGVIGLVVGLAIKNTIADIFCGIALNLDQSFRVGDTVLLHELDKTAVVSEITWRSTRFMTKNNTVLIIPNNKMCSMPITNFSMKEVVVYDLTILLDPEVPQARAMVVLESAALSTEGVLSDPAPEILLTKVDQNGVAYTIYYSIILGKCSESQVKHLLTLNLHRLLTQAGIGLAVSRSKLLYSRLPKFDFLRPPPAVQFIDRIELFASLNEEEKKILIDQHKICKKKRGESVIEIGAEGSSMFVLVEGLLKVMIKMKDREALVKVAYITSGQFFGEMSLLTGEPRSATIIAETDVILLEITKETMRELFVKRGELIEKIGQIVALRRAENMAKEQKLLSDEEKAAHRQSIAAQILGKIKAFFSIQ